jgi:hypothetical protein
MRFTNLPEKILPLASDLVLEPLVVVKDVVIEHMGEQRGIASLVCLSPHAIENVLPTATRMRFNEPQNLDVNSVLGGAGEVVAVMSPASLIGDVFAVLADYVSHFSLFPFLS